MRENIQAKTANMRRQATRIVAIVLILALDLNAVRSARVRLKDICRVKGQEQNTLRGLGIVVGLNGSGDGDTKPTARALSTVMRLMGNPLSPQQAAKENLQDLSDAKNVAIVFVLATVPSAGARQGDSIDCGVSAISASSSKPGFPIWVEPGTAPVVFRSPP